MWAREQCRALAFGEFIPPARSAVSFADVVAGFVESRREQVSPHSWRTDFDNLSCAAAVWGNLAAVVDRGSGGPFVPYRPTGN